MGGKAHSWKIIGIIALLSLLIVYGVFDPEKVGWFPRCIIRAITGVRCPGCGLQRALHDVLNADLAGAVRHNAYVLVSVPVLLLYLFDFLTCSVFVRFHQFITGKKFIVYLVVLTVAWWIFRNIIGI